MISARVISDSIGQPSPRLTTFLVRYPKFIHAEHCRHRMMSFCVSSSRAIPVARNLEEVRSIDHRAGPVRWTSEQRGMSGGEDLPDPSSAQAYWGVAATMAANAAESMAKLGVHKSIVNRLIEPFLHVNVLVTSCEPGLLNFFGLRLDKAAQPEIRALAEEMWKVWNESIPAPLRAGEWHLPFIDQEDRELVCAEPELRLFEEEMILQISAARCARLSYMSFETGKRSTIKEDIALYERLLAARPIHASPAEHQAAPDSVIYYPEPNRADNKIVWEHPSFHGNLPGWVQHRKLLPDEAIAALPEGYA